MLEINLRIAKGVTEKGRGAGGGAMLFVAWQWFKFSRQRHADETDQKSANLW